MHGKNGVRKHDKSVVRSNSDWGSLPQFATATGLMMFAHDHIDGINNQSYVDLGVTAINYMLGENSKGYSFLIGFGDKFPRSPHHRNVYDGGDINKPAKRIGKGLWVAGEKKSSPHQDRYDDWVTNECGCYNAQFNVLLAPIVHRFQAS